jgi:hypothetical protein
MKQNGLGTFSLILREGKEETKRKTEEGERTGTSSEIASVDPAQGDRSREGGREEGREGGEPQISAGLTYR